MRSHQPAQPPGDGILRLGPLQVDAAVRPGSPTFFFSSRSLQNSFRVHRNPLSTDQQFYLFVSPELFLRGKKKGNLCPRRGSPKGLNFGILLLDRSKAS